MSLSDKISELADYAVHAGLVAWFFFYFLVKYVDSIFLIVLVSNYRRILIQLSYAIIIVAIG